MDETKNNCIRNGRCLRAILISAGIGLCIGISAGLVVASRHYRTAEVGSGAVTAKTGTGVGAGVESVEELVRISGELDVHSKDAHDLADRLDSYTGGARRIEDRAKEGKAIIDRILGSKH